MKKILIIIMFLGLSGTGYADTITINVTPEQVKAIQAQVISPQGWLQKAWDMKAANCVEKIGKIKVGKLKYRNLTKAEKLQIIKNTEFELPSEERQKKLMIDRIIP